MDNHLIKNFDSLASTKSRKAALTIAEAGLLAIDTEQVINQAVSLEEGVLKIKDQAFDLSQYKKIYVLGFGKASCNAILALDGIIRDHITAGIAIDVATAYCQNPNILFFQGTHPKPSPANVAATQEIINLAKDINGDELILCVVSGGGSALLCASDNECWVSSLIYDAFLKTGGTINELNTLRKHSSALKGGGLAKLFYPATIAGLIFSDIPGGQLENVASGPTFKDTTTLSDVKNIIAKYRLKLPANLQFFETPKDNQFFQKVANILMISNHQALEAMAKAAKQLGFKTEIISETITGPVAELAKKLTDNLPSKQIRLGAGEPSVSAYKGVFGKGGRNQQLVLESLPYLKNNQVVLSLGSDGIDNNEAAGAIADSQTLNRAKGQLDYQQYRDNLNAFPFFDSLEDLIMTGPTGSNVADLMLSLKL